MPEQTHSVFVYGLLLREASERAELLYWRLAFDSFATVERAEGERVCGGVVYVTPRGLQDFDRIEGVNPADPESGRGYYRREYLPLANGSWAWVYIMNDRRGYAPSAFYVEGMRVQYERLGHPVQELENALV